MSASGRSEPRSWMPGYYDYSGNWIPGHWSAPPRSPAATPARVIGPRHPQFPGTPYHHPLGANQGYGYDSPWQAGVYGGNSGLGYGGFGPYGEPYGQQNLSYRPSRPNQSAETWGQVWDEQANVAAPAPPVGDDELRNAIADRLARHGYDPQAIQVAVDGGEVTLTGAVGSRQEKRRAEDVAEAVGGVRDVHNRLRISGQETAGDD